ncbi:hypothetical protein T484DRAFT_1883045 [Baffinella frigidus]|nr:hypothetical protein T484DRAFT_1883045 [Cryptophyta sp. CCMP2293]
MRSMCGADAGRGGSSGPHVTAQPPSKRFSLFVRLPGSSFVGSPRAETDPTESASPGPSRDIKASDGKGRQSGATGLTRVASSSGGALCQGRDGPSEVDAGRDRPPEAFGRRALSHDSALLPASLATLSVMTLPADELPSRPSSRCGSQPPALPAPRGGYRKRQPIWFSGDPADVRETRRAGMQHSSFSKSPVDGPPSPPGLSVREVCDSLLRVDARQNSVAAAPPQPHIAVERRRSSLTLRGGCVSALGRGGAASSSFSTSLSPVDSLGSVPSGSGLGMRNESSQRSAQRRKSPSGESMRRADSSFSKSLSDGPPSLPGLGVQEGCDSLMQHVAPHPPPDHLARRRSLW